MTASRSPDIESSAPLWLRLYRRWPTVLACATIGSVVLFGIESVRPPVFRSTAQVLVQPTDLGSQIAGLPAGDSNDSQLLATEKEIASLPEVYRRALEETATSGPDPKLDVSTATNSAGRSNVLRIGIDADTAPVAETMATALARAYVTYREELQTAELRAALTDIEKRLQDLEVRGLTEGTAYQGLVARAEQLNTAITVGSRRARVIGDGTVALRTSPNPGRMAFLGALAGLLFGVGAGSLRDHFDRRVRTEQAVQSLLGAAILGQVPDPARVATRTPLVLLDDPNAAASEAFRLLRTNVVFALAAHPGNTFVVTSVRASEGKSFVAANLAVALAQGGKRVLLLDLDLRRPTVHRYFQLGRGPGVSDIVAESASVESAICEVDIGGTIGGSTQGSLGVLPAGTPVPNPGEFVSSERLRALVTSLKTQADVLLLDAPPALVVSDPIALSGVADASLLVVRIDQAETRSLLALREVIEGAGLAALGAVLTAVPGRQALYAGGSYGGESDEDVSLFGPSTYSTPSDG